MKVAGTWVAMEPWNGASAPTRPHGVFGNHRQVQGGGRQAGGNRGTAEAVGVRAQKGRCTGNVGWGSGTEFL